MKITDGQLCHPIQGTATNSFLTYTNMNSIGECKGVMEESVSRVEVDEKGENEKEACLLQPLPFHSGVT